MLDVPFKFFYVPVSVLKGCKTWMLFRPDIFNMYSKEIQRELEDLLEFIIGGYNLSHIRYTDDTVLITDTEMKLQDLLQKMAEKRILTTFPI